MPNHHWQIGDASLWLAAVSLFPAGYGSGDGIRQLSAGSVDIAASHFPLTDHHKADRAIQDILTC